MGINQVVDASWLSILKTTSGLLFDLRLLAIGNLSFILRIRCRRQSPNIAIMAAILLKGSQPVVGRRNSAWVALGGVTIYTVLVGAEASVVRAAVMAALFIFATSPS